MLKAFVGRDIFPALRPYQESICVELHHAITFASMDHRTVIPFKIVSEVAHLLGSELDLLAKLSN